MGVTRKETRVVDLPECSRCGRCCQYIAFKSHGMSPETTEWLIVRGCFVDGDYLVLEHWCPHLSYDGIATCDLHETKEFPVLCRRYHGHGHFYVPKECVYHPTKKEVQRSLPLDESIS